MAVQLNIAMNAKEEVFIHWVIERSPGYPAERSPHYSFELS